MGIAQKVAREFGDAVRSRGQSYFAKGRVRITSAKPGEVVVAKVRGTETYRVKLRMRGGRLHASCSCPFFHPTGVPCKHLWATVLAVDSQSLLVAPPVRPLILVADIGRNANGNQAPPQGQGQGQGQGQARPPQGHGPGHGQGQGQGPGPGQPRGHQGRAQVPPGQGYPQGSPGNGPPPDLGYRPYPPQRPPQGQGAGQGRNKNRRDRPGGVPQRPDLPGARPQGHGPGALPGALGPQPYPQGGRAARKKQRTAQLKAKQAGRSSKRMLAYVLDVPSMLNKNEVAIDLARRERRTAGDWGPLRPWWHAPGGPPGRYDPEDRELLTLLEDAQPLPAGATVDANGIGPSVGIQILADMPGTRRFVVRPERQAAVIEQLARSGRLRLRRAEGEEDPPTMRWDDGPAWRFALDLRADPGGKRWSWRGALRRNADRMDLAEPLVILPDLIFLASGRVARFDDAGVLLWAARLRQEKEIAYTDAQQDANLARMLAEARIPPSELIESVRFDEIDVPVRPSLTLRTPMQSWTGPDRVLGELAFEYGPVLIHPEPRGRLWVSTEQGVLVRRDEQAERDAVQKLEDLGFRDAKDPRLEPGTLELTAKRMPQVTKELVQAGWRVEAEGHLIRPAAEFELSVSTGIDWFELGGHVDFGGGQGVPLPELLAAAGRGETMIALGDGSMGMLPEDWLKKYGALVEMGTAAGGAIRFGRAQAGLLDALLASQTGKAEVDAPFAKVRQTLRKFEGVTPKDAPPGFRGELRPYQREGLGWLEYLQKFDFGGILADDMGLGKTVQVLALLQSRRARRQAKGPSLIVVPRSLVFNWKQEAERFTPRLRVLDYTGPGRHALREQFDDHDLVITTYGTLRTDIVELGQVMFDYLILDEAQAIKNAESQAAKAARLLKGRHRLAMSGTPIENHLGELWSIFEFLNPGMLGPGSVFKRHAAGATAADESARGLLARSLRPFILRRTKSQVVKDLPEKVEQTLYCDMEAAQRKIYEDLRAHYRGALLRREAGSSTNKIEVLEALLRLRQAACHPGLIDPERAGESAAKLDMLLPQLEEVVEEGHKVLVFSQFTKFLAIVRDRLDQAGYRYEYLDGRTRDRAGKVERFQNDPDIPVFLISLKAGGLGLNLTAAGYVYLLDPWWNPAVEAQAIDRSHRIGQTQNVFAYRLIAKDTVEQKILELQQRKRDLADAILNADDNRLIANLTRDDLEFLLS